MPPLTKRDILQVTAFHAIYRRLRRAEEHRRSAAEDFAEAILATCDERFRKTDAALVDQWIREYGNTRNRRKAWAENED